MASFATKGRAMQRYFDSKLYSDIDIQLGDRKVHAHRIILAEASEYFRAAFERGFKEANATTLTLYDDDPVAVNTMLRYFYGFDPSSSDASSGIYTKLRLFAVAGKYGITDLQQKAAESVKEALHEKVRSSAFPQILKYIYEETPAHEGELLKEAALLCRSNIVPLMRDRAFKELLLDVPGIAVAALGLVAKEEFKR